MAELKDKDEQYRDLLKYKNKSKNRNHERNMIIFLRVAFALSVFTILIVFILFLIHNYNDIVTVARNMSDKKIAGVKVQPKQDLTPSKFNFKMLNRYQNILLLGVDSNGPNTLPFSGVRSDTMIVINIDVKEKSVNAISIPRDSKVYIADEHGVQKINAAYAIGGIELTKKTIEETFGIKIHNYVIVNAEGVRQLIDAIGGVPIYVEHDLKYHDYAGDLHIDLKKGEHILSGREAEGYVRFRKDYLGDIGRVNRQQNFLRALIEKVKSPESVAKIPEALKIANLYTRTDLNLYQMSQYAAIAREIDLNKVEFLMLPGNPNKKGIISYWILDPDKTQEVINRLIYRKKIELLDSDIAVGVMYSKSKELDVIEIKEALKNAGYNITCSGRAKDIEKTEIVGYNTNVTRKHIKNLKEKVPALSGLKYEHKPVRHFCPSSDLVITIKEDDIN